MMCSASLLNEELARTKKKMFESNVYLADIIKRVIGGKIRRFKEPSVLGSSLCPIYLKLP